MIRQPGFKTRQWKREHGLKLGTVQCGVRRPGWALVGSQGGGLDQRGIMAPPVVEQDANGMA